MSTISGLRAAERMRRAAAVVLALVAVTAARAGERADWPGAEDGGWARVGSGTMRWLGIEVYAASLWTQGGERWSADRPYALRIEYRRPISARRLVSTSLDEMARLGQDEPGRWRGELERALPSVAAGDVIVGVARPGRGAAFYHRGSLTAEVRDERFAEAFFAIWLDQRTREPELRSRLLGSGDEG